MNRLAYYIKQRDNPQTGTYYVPYGQMTAAEAKRRESTLYGYNYMLRFATKQAYLAKLAELRKNEERILDVQQSRPEPRPEQEGGK